MVKFQIDNEEIEANTGRLVLIDMDQAAILATDREFQEEDFLNRLISRMICFHGTHPKENWVIQLIKSGHVKGYISFDLEFTKHAPWEYGKVTISQRGGKRRAKRM